MQFLDENAIIAWYHYSVTKSGFLHLTPVINDIWKKLAMLGMYSVPPGFIAAIMRKLTPINVGARSMCKDVFEVEAKYIKQILSSEGADRLNSVFYLVDLSDHKNNIVLSFEQIMLKLPAFEHQKIVFVETEFNKAFEKIIAGTSTEYISEYMDFEPILEEIYKKASNIFAINDIKFSNEDLFEITYPKLFTKPSSKLFYRIMSPSMKAMEFWLRDTYSIVEESPIIVAKYGEPQALSIGGYDELTNKGTISSMLTSELAYIDDSLDFDLFDYKYAENQLLYFKRDTSSTFRIRRDIIIKINMTEFFEHEKNLGLLFASIFCFSNKLIEIYFKDMVNVIVLLEGYKPTALVDAMSFFEYFLKIKGLNNRVSITLVEKGFDINEFAKPNTQQFLFANFPKKNFNYVYFEFPQNDLFANLSQKKQEAKVGQLIGEKIRKMVNNEYDSTELAQYYP